MAKTTIEQLRQIVGMGVRKNKYLIQVPLSGKTGSGSLLNILCQATALPERSNSSTSFYMAGRKYNVRGETEFPGTYDITVIDDLNATLRKEFDKWLNSVDNTSRGYQHVSGDGAANVEVFSGNELSTYESRYQYDIKVWQLDVNGNKIYGYMLQNCFPTSLGSIELSDEADNGLSEFSVSLTYSEMIPIITIEDEYTDPKYTSPGTLNNSSNNYANPDAWNPEWDNDFSQETELPPEAYAQGDLDMDNYVDNSGIVKGVNEYTGED